MRTSTFPTACRSCRVGATATPSAGPAFMELASVLAGERWSDHPSCTHPLLAQLARQVNDAISDEGRRLLAAADPRRSSGSSATRTPPSGCRSRWPRASCSPSRRRRSRSWPPVWRARGRDLRRRSCAGRPAPPARSLDLVPGAVAWVDRLEVRGRINRKAYAERCAPTMVRCSIEGVMNAGGPEADARLRDLLGSASTP